VNKNISLNLTAVIIAIILSLTIIAMVEASNKNRYDPNKSKPETAVGTLKRSIYYDKETVYLLKEIKELLKDKESIAFFIIIACIVVIYGIKRFVESSSTSPQKQALAKAKVKGDVNAPIQIAEFVDFQCPSCAHGAKDLKKFMGEHPNTIRLEVKYFPLKMHKHAVLSARYAECAARQNKFWPFHDYLFKGQNKWKRLLDAKPVFEFISLYHVFYHNCRRYNTLFCLFSADPTYLPASSTRSL